MSALKNVLFGMICGYLYELSTHQLSRITLVLTHKVAYEFENQQIDHHYCDRPN